MWESWRWLEEVQHSVKLLTLADQFLALLGAHRTYIMFVSLSVCPFFKSLEGVQEV